MPLDVARAIRVVLTDIDDTLTSECRLSAAAYQALESLEAAGLAVAAVTGRPAGWCDMIARCWPVAGVVGENGAFYFAYDVHGRRMRRVYAADFATRTANRQRLEDVRKRILAAAPAARVAADQAYREADLAIDIGEDVQPLNSADVAHILDIFAAAEARAKLSSIHVNGWFGDYDKLTMTRRFATEILGLDLERERERVIFVGDSPNDAPMFGFFPNACGVANVLNFAGRLEASPTYVTQGAGGTGFAEVARHLLAARGLAA
ncbi:MAG: HAD family hydrolase [Acetobacteraceae bacterium]